VSTYKELIAQAARENDSFDGIPYVTRDAIFLAAWKESDYDLAVLTSADVGRPLDACLGASIAKWLVNREKSPACIAIHMLINIEIFYHERVTRDFDRAARDRLQAAKPWFKRAAFIGT